MSSAEKEAFVVPELRVEREGSSLDVQELTAFVDGSEFMTEKKRKMCELTS